jgi:DNA-binding MarR family transcriptional regulator
MHRNLLLNLLGAVYWFDDALQDNMEAQGFSRTTRAISFILLNIAHGEHRAMNIARNLGISRQAVSAMLLGLRDRGMLDIREDPADRRSQIVEFSREFAKQGAACAEILAKLESEVARRIGRSRFKAMNQALAENWGSPPKLQQLSKKELLHGKAAWQKQERQISKSKALHTAKSQPNR